MNEITFADLHNKCYNYTLSKDNFDNGTFLEIDEKEEGTLCNLFVVGEVIDFLGIKMRCTQNYVCTDLYKQTNIYLEVI
jgi:hypothetical protein